VEAQYVVAEEETSLSVFFVCSGHGLDENPYSVKNYLMTAIIKPSFLQSPAFNTQCYKKKKKLKE
jgi:hypothetical protein